MASTQAVIAGVDGSAQSYEAARWAAAEAHRRHAPLRLVIVNDDPARTEYAEKAVRGAAEDCRAQTPELEVTEEVVTGHPIDELLRRCQRAQLMVVGSRGRGGFTDALLGSVSTAVATHGRCPVAVLRGYAGSTGPVVVGVEDSPGSQAAVEFGVATAAQRGTELVAVQVWQEEGLLAPPLPPEDRDQVQQQVERSLAQQITKWSAHYPDVRIRSVVCRGHPVAALTDAARDAQLLVVGHRGRGGFAGLFLGSVASGVLHHARCPVTVVPLRKDEHP
jgi:nucleotide-binding universal stress UspA family protein